MFDYHLHSRFSHDSQEDPWAQVRRAEQLGLREICFTEHVEFDENRSTEAFDLAGYYNCLHRIREQANITVRIGAEIGLKDGASYREAMAFLAPYPLDFIIGSVHWTDEGDAYQPEYFAGRTKECAYRRYLELALPRLKSGNGYQVMGHIDYPAKQAPFGDRSLEYAVAPEAFDAIFRYLIGEGIGLEINTSVYRTPDAPMWGLDYLRRYVELGGEFVTIGSDAHRAERLGWRNADAVALAKAAGIRYLATFHEKQLIFHRL